MEPGPEQRSPGTMSPEKAFAAPAARDWDLHWRSLKGRRSLFSRIATLVRKQLLSRAVRHYGSTYFPTDGVFVEMGCGSAESSFRLDARRRHLVGLDFSLAALQEARVIHGISGLVQGDILRLGLRDATVAGVWNLGVMEHFPEAAGLAILSEFRRVLSPGGVLILFWPPTFGSSRLVLGPLERVLSWRRREPFSFFPDEVNRLRSREHARQLMFRAGFDVLAVDFSFRDLFIHVVAVGRKPTS